MMPTLQLRRTPLFRFQGAWELRGVLAANFGDVDMTSSTILNSRAIQ